MLLENSRAFCINKMQAKTIAKKQKKKRKECNRSIKRRIENLKNIGYNRDRLEV